MCVCVSISMFECKYMLEYFRMSYSLLGIFVVVIVILSPVIENV